MSLQQQLDTETHNALEFFRGMSKDDLQTIMTGFDAMASEDARRWKLLAVSLHKQANSAVSPDESSTDLGRDVSRQRFLNLIFAECRTRILNGDIEPTVRDTTATVTEVINMHTRTLGVNISPIGSYDQEQLARKILEKLEGERVIEKTWDNRYVLTARYRSN